MHALAGVDDGVEDVPEDLLVVVGEPGPRLLEQLGRAELVDTFSLGFGSVRAVVDDRVDEAECGRVELPVARGVEVGRGHRCVGCGEGTAGILCWLEPEWTRGMTWCQVA